jgi:hypothetical protein
MKSLLLALSFCFFLLNNTFSQELEKPTFSLFLVGDAGEDDTTEATLRDLGIKLHETENSSAVIFLGDNCYRNAMYGILPTEVKGYDGSRITRARIISQLNILDNYRGSAYFIPGNHDWWNYTNLRLGKKALSGEEHFIEDHLKNSSLKNRENTFIPDNGNPGPVYREFNDGKTRVIFIDSYRLILEEGGKKKDTLLLNTFYRNLKNMLAEGSAKKQKIVVVAHHPIHAKGKHALPLAAWETLVRRLADANTNYPPYNRMATHLDSLLKEQHHPDIYYVAGHEHSLEYFFNDSLHYLVSGAGSKVDQVDYKETVNENEYFIWNEEGFFEIQFFGRFERVLMYHRKNAKAKIEVHCVAGCS